jgi:anthranilate phosphoribosyltransferase
MLTAALRSLVEQGSLTRPLLEAAFADLLQGGGTAEEVAAFLAALRMKGETADDLVALAGATRQAMIRFDAGGSDALDTAGTGGDGSGTFNISTAAALVVAATGQPVIKHGNRGFSSKSGSADVLEAMGIPIDVPPALMRECFAQTGFAFCFTPLYHPAARHAAAVRRSLGFRTIFNLLGPLVNPAGTPYQVIGVGTAAALPLLAEAVRRLGVRRAAVLRGDDGVDEVSLNGRTRVMLIATDSQQEMHCDPEDFGLTRQREPPPSITSARESAAIIQTVLQGKECPASDWVLANAGIGLWIAGRATTLAEGVRQARQAIQSGAAAGLVTRLRTLRDRLAKVIQP